MRKIFIILVFILNCFILNANLQYILNAKKNYQIYSGDKKEKFLTPLDIQIIIILKKR